MHRKVKILTDRKKNVNTASSCIRDEEGNMLFEREDVAKRWVEYVKKLYDDVDRRESEHISCN